MPDSDIERYGEWLSVRRNLKPKPVSDYKARLRRVLTEGSSWSTWTKGVQADVKTTTRAFIEYRTGRLPS